MSLRKPTDCGPTISAPPKRRRGAMMILIALMLPIFLGVVAFLVDAAYMQLVRTELRIATDAAARAGGEALSRLQDEVAARAAAKAMAATHLVAGEPLVLDDSDVTLGHVCEQPNGKWVFSLDGTVNGMRVAGRRTDDSPSGPVKLFFARIFSFYDFETSCSAVSVRLDRDICLVVDRSSSMKLSVEDLGGNISSSDPRFSLPPNDESRWAALEDAVVVFNDALATTDPIEYVSLVSYGSTGTWCGIYNNVTEINQVLTSDLTGVQNAVQAIGNRIFNGATEISTGIDAAVPVVKDPERARPYAAKTMIVLTDGIPTGGRPVVDAARDAALAGITVHTITFGDGANQTLMQDVAAAGGGIHYHATDALSLNQVLHEIALTLPVLLTE